MRDLRYLLPLAMLLGVVLISAAMGAGPKAVTSAVPEIPYVPRAQTGSSAPDPDLIRDQARAIDLGGLREAALDAHRRTGAFPDSGNSVVTLCETIGDAGCALREARGLPGGDGEFPYYYASDGKTYAVFIARAESNGDTSKCPRDLPSGLKGVPLICVYVEPGS
jgi:hypothetical protein